MGIQENILESERKATIAITFEDKLTKTILKELAKNLQNWDKMLKDYYQIIYSDTPEENKIVSIQNDSLAFFVSTDLNLAIYLAEIFKYGFRILSVYLTFKRHYKSIIGLQPRNPVLIASAVKKEEGFVKDFKEIIMTEIIKQHTEALKTDTDIDKPPLNNKLKEITDLVISHILKGNDFKLMALPGNNAMKDKHIGIMEGLEKVSSEAKKAFKAFPEKEMEELFERYMKIDLNSQLIL